MYIHIHGWPLQKLMQQDAHRMFHELHYLYIINFIIISQTLASKHHKSSQCYLYTYFIYTYVYVYTHVYIYIHV